MEAEAVDVEGITDGRESPVKMSQLWEHKLHKHFKLIGKKAKPVKETWEQREQKGSNSSKNG